MRGRWSMGAAARWRVITSGPAGCAKRRGPVPPRSSCLWTAGAAAARRRAGSTGARRASPSTSAAGPGVPWHLGRGGRRADEGPAAEQRLAPVASGRLRRGHADRRPPAAGTWGQPGDAPVGGTGRLTAAGLWGAGGLATAEDPVGVVLPPGTRWRPGPGVVVRSAPLDRDVVRSGPWLRWTGRVRTAVDLIRRDGTDEAVVLLDRLVCARMVDLGAVRTAVEALPRCRGSAYAHRAATLADGLAESPPETRLRLLLHRSGLPLPRGPVRGPVRWALPRAGRLRVAGVPPRAGVRRGLARSP